MSRLERSGPLALLLVVLVLVAFPFYWMLLTSVTPREALFKPPFRLVRWELSRELDAYDEYMRNRRFLDAGLSAEDKTALLFLSRFTAALGAMILTLPRLPAATRFWALTRTENRLPLIRTVTRFGVATRIARRTKTSPNTPRPSMKCQTFSASRMSLPFGKNPRSSMHAYTPISSASISQCMPIDHVP